MVRAEGEDRIPKASIPLCAGMVPVDPQDVRFVVCIPPVRRDGSLFDLGVQYLTELSSL